MTNIALLPPPTQQPENIPTKHTHLLSSTEKTDDKNKNEDERDRQRERERERERERGRERGRERERERERRVTVHWRFALMLEAAEAVKLDTVAGTFRSSTRKT